MIWRNNNENNIFRKKTLVLVLKVNWRTEKRQGDQIGGYHKNHKAVFFKQWVMWNQLRGLWQALKKNKIKILKFILELML